MDEQLLSNLSYTNKDFRTIYPEMLDLVKKLSNKWDPSLSNESDPGVLLLKLNALIADKCNYNIDKNVLECFPLSVTQMGNAREIYDSRGYTMRWYQSATTSVNIKWAGEKSDAESITIDRFTMVTDSSGETVYTLTEKKQVPKDNSNVSIPAIEGTNYQYEINGETNITLENLDANLRLFFTERQIAENGIFITNRGVEDYYSWQAVNNLESTPLGQKVYKFGILPNTDTCYIQFPQDIANLIEDGLNITYVISKGVEGNISANTLDTLYSDVVEELTDPNSGEKTTSVVNDYLQVSNGYSANDGADPEDIKEAYENYKKTIGTFNNLVTCRDYTNAIYNLLDYDHPQFKHTVSNCIVTDRTNDIHNGYYIQTITDEGETKKLIQHTKDVVVQLADGSNGLLKQPTMTAFDLGLYLLDPMSNIYAKDTFNHSFAPDPTLLYTVASAISDAKSVQHDYIDNSNYDTYIYRNDYTLNCKIATYYKVSDTEAKNIIENVKVALFKAFNARNVSFGKPIDYDELLEVIEGADTRIKMAILDEPSYTINKVSARDITSHLTQYDELEIHTKSVLSGATPLNKFDNRFEYEFGQENFKSRNYSKVYDDIRTVSTDAFIPRTAILSGAQPMQATDLVGYEVKKNENIQLFAPNLQTVNEYSVGIYFQVKLSHAVRDGVDYQLQADEGIKFRYTKDNTTHTPELGPGTIIQISGFNLEPTNGGWSAESNLGSSKKISVREINSTTFEVKDNGVGKMYLYWITNLSNTERDTYTLRFNMTKEDNGKYDGEYILQTGEYFMYTDNLESSELILLGSGTKISVHNVSSLEWSRSKLELTSITENGLSAFTQSDWYIFEEPYSSFTTTETQIVSIGEGSRVWAQSFLDTDSEYVSHIPTAIEGVYYTNEAGEWNSLPIISLGKDASWQIMSTLNLDATPTTPQTLYENQVVTLKFDDSAKQDVVLTEGQSFMFSTPVMLMGGQDIDVAVLDYDGNYSYTLDAYVFKQGEKNFKRVDDFITLDNFVVLNSAYSTYYKINYTDKDAIVNNKLLTKNEITSIESDNVTYDFTDPTKNYKAYVVLQQVPNSGKGTQFSSKEYIIIYNVEDKVTYNFNFKLNSNSLDTRFIIPVVFIQMHDTDTVTINAGEYATDNSETILTKGGAYYLSPTNGELTFNIDNLSQSHLLIGKITKLNGFFNKEWGKAILDNIGILDKDKLFNFTYMPNEETMIADPTLANAFWESNHIYNTFTIPKLDVDNSVIEVLKSSKL